MHSNRKKVFTFFVSGIVILCCIVFTVTLSQAALYSPNDVGDIADIGSIEDDGGVTQAQTFQVSTGLVPTEQSVATTSAISTTTVSVAVSDAHNAYPSRLIIPSLSIDAHVQYVGVNKKGNIGTPNNFTDVAWYARGVVPGQLGTAIIDGHVDNGLGLAGVFKHLVSMKVGDDVYVVTKGAEHIHFVVTHVEAYDYEHVTSEDIFGTSTDVRSINLITCDGEWVLSGDTYNKRLIVTATLAP